jgi:hypothetical protein
MSLLTVGTVAFDDIETPFGRAKKSLAVRCYIHFIGSVLFLQKTSDGFGSGR